MNLSVFESQVKLRLNEIRGRGLERSLELRVFVSSSFFNTYSYRMLQITGGETFQSTLLSCGRASFTKYKRD